MDLVEIKQHFLITHQKQLSTAIHGDTSGDYRKVLLAVIGDEPIVASGQQQGSSSKLFGSKNQGSSDELAYLRAQLAVKEQELSAKEKALAAKNDELAAARHKLSEKEGEVTAKDQALSTKTTELATTMTTLTAKEGELVSKDEALTTKTDELSSAQQQLTTTEGELASQKEATAAKTTELDAKEQELAEVRRALAGKDAIIHTHETTIVTLRSQTTIVSDHNTSLECIRTPCGPLARPDYCIDHLQANCVQIILLQKSHALLCCNSGSGSRLTGKAVAICEQAETLWF